MQMFKQPITWIVMVCAGLLGFVVGCAVANPEATRLFVRLCFEVFFHLLPYIIAIKLIYFIVDRIIGPPRK